jgi:hypothetical protein
MADIPLIQKLAVDIHRFEMNYLLLASFCQPLQDSSNAAKMTVVPVFCQL